MLTRATSTAERGSVLLAVVIVVLALAGLALAFIETGVQESRSNATADERSRVGYIAETGVNEAVAELVTGGDGIIGSKDIPIAFGGGEYWVHTVDHGDGTYTVTSIGRINNQVEAIEVVLAPEDIPLFSRALFGDLDLGAKGNVFTDSYDSDLGTYAEQAKNTHPKTGHTYAKAEGDLGSNRNIILRGGVTILGSATPGPGFGVQIYGSTVYVDGSTAPNSATMPLPPIDFKPTVPSSGTFNQNADYVFTEGTYRYEHFSVEADAVISFKGDVVLYVDDRFLVSGQARLQVEPDSKVTIYHSGTDFTLTGGGLVNGTQKPSAFRLHTAAESVKLAGNSTFYGAVFAPYGQIDPGGTADLFGSFVARKIDINGSANFHYDEALARVNEETRPRLSRVSWRKVSPADY